MLLLKQNSITILFLLSLNLTLQGQSCTCNEYLYVNGNTTGDVHKFLINDDGSLTEIGDPWLDHPDFSSPHGLGSDLNGFLYIGTHGDNTGNIRKLTCDGDVLSTSDFAINVGVYNLESIDNILYGKTTDHNGVSAWDICSGNKIGEFCFLDANGNVSNNSFSWGLSLGSDGKFYITTNDDGGRIYVFEESALNGGCISPLATNIEAYNNGTGEGAKGITVDNDGNIYVVFGGFFTTCHTIAKFDATGNFITNTQPDCTNGDGGWVGAIGINYSETCNCLYTSNWNDQEDCVSRFDLNLNYLGQAAGSTTGVTPFSSKASSLQKECCPNPNIQTIDRVFCEAGTNEKLFLNEQFACDGVICGGIWVAADAASQAIYNDCEQSIAANLSPGCYSFTKTSSGTHPNAQCGAFELNYNLEILAAPTLTLSTDQTVCNGGVPDELSLTTTATGFQWQMSAISCMDGFSDIAGATSATYTPPALTTTTYYRAIVTETADCSDGNCPFESDCITVTVDPTCSACSASTPEIAVTDNDCNTATAGSFDIITDCTTGVLEWSTDGGTTWSTTIPSYDVMNVLTVMARCYETTEDCAVDGNMVTSAPSICPNYDVSLSKSVDKSTATIGEEIIFTITVENLGDAATGATVNDVLPLELTYNGVYTASTGTYDGTNWTIGNMAIGQKDSIQITATVNADGVINNTANVSINETETNEANNEDAACVSVPIEVCSNTSFTIQIVAQSGLAMYQWYQDGILIDGATSDTYMATEAGTYTYTSDGVGPTGDCLGELCCPVIIEEISCCAPIRCLPITVTKLN